MSKMQSKCQLLSTINGAFKWDGDFEDLKCLFDEVLEITTVWTSPGGSSKKCECDGLTVRWYSTSGSLTFKDENADRFKNQLLKLMEAGYENVSMLPQYKDQTIYNNDKIYCSSDDDGNRITQNINGTVGTNLINLSGHVSKLIHLLEKEQDN